MLRYKIKDKVTYKEIKHFMKKIDNIQGINSWKTNVFDSQYRYRSKELETIKKSIYFTVRKNKRLIGLLRVITGGYLYLITEVAILPSYRKIGIGKQLLNMTIDYCKQNKFIKILLLANPDVENYYTKFGFSKTRCQAMEIRYSDKKET